MKVMTFSELKRLAKPTLVARVLEHTPTRKEADTHGRVTVHAGRVRFSHTEVWNGHMGGDRGSAVQPLFSLGVDVESLLLSAMHFGWPIDRSSIVEFDADAEEGSVDRANLAVSYEALRSGASPLVITSLDFEGASWVKVADDDSYVVWEDTDIEALIAQLFHVLAPGRADRSLVMASQIATKLALESQSESRQGMTTRHITTALKGAKTVRRNFYVNRQEAIYISRTRGPSSFLKLIVTAEDPEMFAGTEAEWVSTECSKIRRAMGFPKWMG
jgi:hypothetical protein